MNTYENFKKLISLFDRKSMILIEFLEEMEFYFQRSNKTISKVITRPKISFFALFFIKKIYQIGMRKKSDLVKFMFSKKVTKIDKIFTVELMLKTN